MAGGVTLGFLKYVLGFDSITFRKGMTDAERDLVKLQKSFEKKGKQLTELGKGLTAFVTLPLAGLAAAGIKEAQETATAMAQVNAAIASTGAAAGVTAQQLKTASDALELKSLFEGDEILKDLSARLLAFGNVTGATFLRAQQDIVDFATRTGRDLGSATTLIGKALNDPAKAMGVLSKAGVQLSADQQALVKQFVETGNVAGAQGVILGALETKYRGAAEAAQNADPWNKLQDAFKGVAEQIGTAILPIMPALANAVSAVANAFTSLPPGVQTTIIAIAGVAAALGPVLIGLGSLIKLLAGAKTLVLFSQGLLGVAAAEGTAATGATAAGIALRGMLGPIGLALTAATALYFAFEHWDQIKPIVQNMVTGVANALRGMAAGPLENAKKRIAEVTEEFRKMEDRVTRHSYVPDMVDAIALHFGRLDGVMVAPARKAAKAATEAFQKLKSDVGSLLDQLFPDEARLKQQADDIALLNKGLAAGIVNWNKYADAVGRVQGTSSGASVDLAVPAVDHLDGPDLSTIADQLPQIVEQTNQWKTALSDIGRDLLGRIGDDLSAIVSGSMKLKDLWKDLLAFGIRELTSSNGPLGNLLGGARASGGPVLGGSAYLVGERGPEIFMPSSSGRIVSNDNSRRMLGAATGGRGDVYMTVVTPDANSFRRSEGQVTRGLKRRLR
jgi:hypothetical protein